VVGSEIARLPPEPQLGQQLADARAGRDAERGYIAPGKREDRRSPVGGQVEPFPAADVRDQGLLHRGQLLGGHLSDHGRTLFGETRSGIVCQELQWHQPVITAPAAYEFTHSTALYPEDP